MSAEKLHEELSKLETPGVMVEHVRVAVGGIVREREIGRAALPASSPLAKGNTRAYVSRDAHHGIARVVVRLQEIGDGKALIDVVDRGDGDHSLVPHEAIPLVRRAVEFSMQDAGVSLVELDPEITDYSEQALDEIGFRPNDSGMVEFQAA